MTAKIRHKQLRHTKKKYKNLAGMVAAATILSTTMLPGIPAPIAHASANVGHTSATTLQQTGKTNQSSSEINFDNTNKEAPISTPKALTETKQQNKTPRKAPTDNKNTVARPISTKDTAPKDQRPQSTPTDNQDTAMSPTPANNNTKDQKPQTTPTDNQDTVMSPIPVNTNTPKDQKPQTTPTDNQDTVMSPTPAKDNTPKDQSPKPTATDNQDTVMNSAPTKDNTSSPNKPPTDYKQVLDISATAYAPGPHDNDQWGNKTFIGSQVRPGIIAVDPRVIPLGSRVYIEYPDGHGEYAVAEDTGGAIKGNRVDIAKWTVHEAENFGIQNVKVYVVDTPKKI